ncbi:MAG: ABC transporter permease subunit [bacterium]|nr:ABC transporter permease subunit [bacterium]
MINDLAMHRLSKLRSSKIIWVFVGACIFLAAPTILPVIFVNDMAPGSVGIESAAAPFFKLVSFMGHIAALILGITTWRIDYRDGTLLPFAARPIARIELLVGKILGSLYGLLIYLFIAIALYAVLHLIFFRFSIPGVAPLYLLQMLMSWTSTFGLGLLFSNFGNPLLATFLAALYWFFSMMGFIFQQLPFRTVQIIGDVLRFMSIDNYRTYSMDAILKSDLSDVTPIFSGIGYYFAWTLFLVCLSIVLFNKREFIGKRS